MSFARATIARVEQQAGILISELTRKQLEINTYHGFTWNLLKSHGYLINSNVLIRLLPPPEAASRLADIKDATRKNAEKLRLFKEEGLLHFDLFAETAAELLSKSQALTTIICDAYPCIILDEFQDTNTAEWNLIQILGQRSKLIALADAEQRIYEFRGASPTRITEFTKVFNPTPFDFGMENNRSNGTDIIAFGNDLITGINKNKKYQDVNVKTYQFRKGNGLHLDLKISVFEGCNRLKNSSNWSLSVLVPTKKLMLDVSDYLGDVQKFSNGKSFPALHHEVALETAGPSLAAVLIADLLEQQESTTKNTHNLIHNLCEHIRGRNGNDSPSNADIALTDALSEYIKSGKIRGKNRLLLIDECLRIGKECKEFDFSGDPGADWLKIRKLLFESCSCELKQVAIDAKYLRLLHKGALLRSTLNELWRMNGKYTGAIVAIKNALLQEHFSTSTRAWTGIHLMTIHKAKGKEFDEVIIYEGVYQGKIVRPNSPPKEIEQSRLALRVAVTRAKKRTTILTPAQDICSLLR